MNKHNYTLQYLLGIFLILSLSACHSTKNDNWENLFNDKDFTGWSFYLSKPDSGIDIAGLPRDSAGNYLKPLADKDPLNVFSMVEDEQPIIKISGEVIGNLYTLQSFENYHLRLKFKWGNKKWE